MVIEAMTEFERWKQHRQEEHRRMQEEKAQADRKAEQCINYCWNNVLGIAEWRLNAFNVEAAQLMGWRFNQTTNTFEPRDCLEKCHSPDE